MAFRSFDVGGVRGLLRAHATDLPNLVCIAGPNGSGKSTLLEAIKARRGEFLEPGSELLYIGPHRTWRSSQLSDVHVLGFPYAYEDVLKQDAIPGFAYGPPGGLHFLSGLPRLAASADDAQALAKTAIVRLDNRQRDLVHEQYVRQGGEVARGTVPDVMKPLRVLITTLLPHLELVDVDHSMAQNIRVVFRRRDREASPTFDIDDLSSGEKAAIGLFLPFVEREAKRLIEPDAAQPANLVRTTMLLDEPETHLHPLLLLNVLEYMRVLAQAGTVQFIFATQSPVLLDAVDDDELFFLAPPDFVTDNQLTRLSGSAERLEIARGLTGSTHLLTRGKPIVFIEGEPEEKATASDERLLKLIAPKAAHWAITPARGRAEVVGGATSLRGAALHLPGMPVFGLVDADTEVTGLPDFVISWPVAMIENLLLDPDHLWRLLQPYEAVTGLHSPQDIRTSLRDIATSRVEDEVRLRIRRALPGAWLAINTWPGDVASALQTQVDALRRRIEAADPAQVAQAARSQVNEILEHNQATERFHGKKMLRSLYSKHNVQQGFSWPGFLIECARAVAGGERATRLSASSIDCIRLYFPADAPEVLALAVETPERARLLEEAIRHREAWEAGAPIETGRETLREAMGHFARGQEPTVAARIFGLANSIGTA